MNIGQVIRQYRKEKDMTQEEMANRLGVTAPAVNKWEKGNSLPDITLLAPIARLLGISLDTLLSFREELTQEEIQDIIYTLHAMLRERDFAEAFGYAKEKIEQYPNCEMLILEAAVLLNAERMKLKMGSESMRRDENRKEKAEKPYGTYEDADQSSTETDYDTVINGWFTETLKSEQEQIRTMAADSLFSIYLNSERYVQAKECLSYYSEQNPERKFKQARLYSRMGQTEDAYKTYEELLFSIYQMANLLLQSIGTLAAQDQNMDKVRSMADKQSALAEIFEMGEYYKICGRLELAVMKKDVEATITIMQRLLANIDDINHFAQAPLYEHMTFRESRPEFIAQLREDLLKSFQDEKAYGFLQGDSRWESLKKR